MHYTLRDAIMDLLGYKIKLPEFVEKMEEFLTLYPRENVYAMYLPLGSHDTRRLMTKLNDDLHKVQLAFLLQFANPGAPAIYYGDEIGMEGEKDPDNRRAFPWDEDQWNHDLRGYVKKLITARKKHPALRRGDLKRVHLSKDNHWYAFSRMLGDDKVVVMINPSSETRRLDVPVKTLDFPNGTVLEDLVTHGRIRVVDQVVHLTLGPWSGAMIGTILEDV
jgi:glycosidase